MSAPDSEITNHGAENRTDGRSSASGFTPIRNRALRVAAVSTGLVAPSVMEGRLVLAVIFGIAVIAAAVAYLPTTRVDDIVRRFRSPLPSAVTITMALWFVSLLAGINLEWSLFVWSSSAGLLIMAGLLHAAFERENWVEPLLLRALVAGSLAFAVAGTLATLIWPVLLDPAGVRGIVSTQVARFALKGYGSLVPCLIFAVLWAGFRLGGGWRTLAVLYVGFGLEIVYLADSKSGMLGLAISIMVLATIWVGLRLRRWMRRLFVAALIVAVGAVMTVIVMALPKPLSTESVVYRIPSELVDRHRQVIWGFVVQNGAKAPIFGHGPGNARHLPLAKLGVAGAGRHVPSHPHNWLIQIFAETGLVGLASLLAVLFILLGRLVLAAGRGETAGWAGIGVTAAFFGSWLVNFSFWAAWWQTAYLVLMVAILGSIARDARADARAK